MAQPIDAPIPQSLMMHSNFDVRHRAAVSLVWLTAVVAAVGCDRHATPPDATPQGITSVATTRPVEDGDRADSQQPTPAGSPGQDAKLPQAPDSAGRPDQLPNPNPYYVNRDNATPLLDGFALVARDEPSGDIGVVVLSRVPMVGAYTIDARAGVAAVANLGIAAGDWNRLALAGMAGESNAQRVIDEIARSQESRRGRCALAIVPPRGAPAFHGAGQDSCSGLAGADWAMIAYDVWGWNRVADIGAAFEASLGLPLAERLYRAMQIAEPLFDPTGRRPALSAALLVVRPEGGAFGGSDRLVDIRVDLFGRPVERLRELLEVHFRAHVAPRLMLMQKSIDDIGSPLYKSNKQWLDRIRRKIPIGVPE